MALPDRPEDRFQVQPPREFVRPGFWISITYVLLMTGYAVATRDAFWAMKPSEFADFLAGTFAPLAFLWLVLGFFQQGDELRNSVAALHLQGEELRNSVEQQRQLVEVTREQLGLDRVAHETAAQEAARRAEPVFHLSGGFSMWSSPLVTSAFTVKNIGAECRQLVFSDGDGGSFQSALFTKGERFTFSYQRHRDQEISPIIVEIECVDMRGNHLKFEAELGTVEGQYGPEYSVASPDGLFRRIAQ